MITKTKKIFVGGLSASTTVEDMKTYFETFGKVRSNAVIGYERFGVYAQLEKVSFS